jgi:hypothetical protein
LNIRIRPRGLVRAVLVLGLALGAPATAQAAEQFAGLTNDDQLVLFRSDSPGALQNAVPISGLQFNEELLGLDVWPTDGRIYALGSSNRIYVLDPTTGHATPVSNVPFAPPLNGTTFAFNIDPTTGQARVISNTGQDLRINVSNGQVAGVDAPFTYQAGDPGAGTTPELAALAYTRPPTGGGSAAMYAIETNRDVLTTAATNAATVRTLGPLNVSVGVPAALDIASDGAAYAALRPGGIRFPILYKLDLTTGAASPVLGDEALSTIAHRISSRTRRDTPVIAMTALGEVPSDLTLPRALLAVPNTRGQKRLLSRGLGFSVACDEACTVAAEWKVGRAPVQRTPEKAVQATAGQVRLRLRIRHDGRVQLRQGKAHRVRLRVTVTDAAGNETTVRRRITVLAPPSAG